MVDNNPNHKHIADTKKNKAFNKRLASARATVNKIKDGLGMPVDGGIKMPVVSFLLNNFPTGQSCEGHSDRGLPFPWILVEYPYPKDPDDQTALDKCDEKNRDAKLRMESLLKDFYSKHQSKYRLGIHGQGIHEAFRVQPAKDESNVTPNELLYYRAEMSQFSDYLMEKAKLEIH